MYSYYLYTQVLCHIKLYTVWAPAIDGYGITFSIREKAEIKRITRNKAANLMNRSQQQHHDGGMHTAAYQTLTAAS